MMVEKYTQYKKGWSSYVHESREKENMLLIFVFFHYILFYNSINKICQKGKKQKKALHKKKN